MFYLKHLQAGQRHLMCRKSKRANRDVSALLPTYSSQTCGCILWINIQIYIWETYIWETDQHEIHQAALWVHLTSALTCFYNFIPYFFHLLNTNDLIHSDHSENHWMRVSVWFLWTEIKKSMSVPPKQTFWLHCSIICSQHIILDHVPIVRGYPTALKREWHTFIKMAYSCKKVSLSPHSIWVNIPPFYCK